MAITEAIEILVAITGVTEAMVVDAAEDDKVAQIIVRIRSFCPASFWSSMDKMRKITRKDTSLHPRGFALHTNSISKMIITAPKLQINKSKYHIYDVTMLMKQS
jgi:hypothetical protein